MIPSLSIQDLLNTALLDFSSDGVLEQDELLKILQLMNYRRCSSSYWCIKEDYLEEVAWNVRATVGLEDNDSHSITVQELAPNIDYFLAKFGPASRLTLLDELSKDLIGSEPILPVVEYVVHKNIAPREQVFAWFNDMLSIGNDFLKTSIMDSYMHG